jgi:hypothetical protein
MTLLLALLCGRIGEPDPHELDRRDRAQAVMYAYESGLVVPGG